MRIALAGLAALAVAMGIGRFAFTPILPMMQSEGLLTLVESGWLASANYVGYLAGALTAMALRGPPARFVRLGLLVVGFATLAMGFTASQLAWLLLRALAGVASAWVLVFASAWCLDHFQHDATLAARERARLAAMLYAGVGTGIALAGGACVVLLAMGAHSERAWTVLGALSLATAAVLWKPFDAGEAGARAGSPAPVSPAWNGEAIRLVACYGAFGFGYIIPATFLAAMAREALPDPALYGWSWPLFGLAAAASTFVAARLRGRMSERSIWIAGQVAMAAGVMVPVALTGLAGIVLSALLVGGTFMVVTMVGMQEARRLAGSAARPLMAAMTAAFATGQIAGPLLVSALAAHGGGYRLSLIVSGVALLASAAALLPTTPRRSDP